MTQSQKAFDVVVYGATGFTGQLVCEYLAQYAPAHLKWAIAGRNRDKLQRVIDAISNGARVTPLPHVLEADASRPDSLHAMAAQARVVLTTVGPYDLHGEPLVQACIEHGSDYVDLTGEPPFVDRMIARYHERAGSRGVRIVHACGFDSIPHDLGAFYTIQKLAPTSAATIEAFVSARATFSGGTWQSALNIMSQSRGMLQKQRQLEREGLPCGARMIRLAPARVHYEARINAWAMPLPTIDPEVVLRSATMLSEYGPDFRYGHYARMKKLATVVGAGIGAGTLLALAQFPPARELLKKVKASGEGPSAAQREQSWFKVKFIGSTEARVVMTQVSGGDPGYTETSKMISEAALCLAFDREQLPAHAGVLTPATAMGQPLIDRLQRAGIKFSELPTT